MSDYSEKTKEILKVVLKISKPEVIEKLSMKNNANWDSMAHLSIVTGIENEFDIFIEASDTDKLMSYKDIVVFLNEHPDI